MVASHLARDVLTQPHPLWLRLFGSLAAPLFVLLSGMLVAQTRESRRRPLSYFLSRGSLVVLIAMLLDTLLWGIYPLVTYDVLYVIGVAMPIAALFCELRPTLQTGLLVALLGVSGMLRHGLGYPEAVVTLPLTDSPLALWNHRSDILHQFLVAGWFPMFPWLFFSLLGVRVYQWRQAIPQQVESYLLRTAMLLLAVGLACGLIVDDPFYIRNGYSELFYPPTAAVVIVASGAVLSLFACVRLPLVRGNRLLILLGKAPLLLYVVHLMIIHWGIQPLFPEASLSLFLLLYFGLLGALAGLASGIERLKQQHGRHWPLPIRLLIGG